MRHADRYGISLAHISDHSVEPLDHQQQERRKTMTAHVFVQDDPFTIAQ